MKKNLTSYTPLRKHIHAPLLFLLMILVIASCKKHDFSFPLKNYEQVNLVSDVSGYNAAHIDKALLNAWGIAVAPSGPIWISANHSGSSPVYSSTGATLIPPVWVPGPDSKTPGAPTGIVFNSTSDFIIKSTNQKGRFIFAGEDGVISAWGGGTAAIKVADRSAWEAVYKGLALASDMGANFLYATDFKNSHVDVFDKDFNYVSNKPFKDPQIPSDYGPFNIRLIDGFLYVTYAKHKGPDNEDDEAGAGHGYIDVYTTGGILVHRFASGGALNSPWGLVAAKGGFCDVKDAILVGNFGDGRINVYGRMGNFEGQLKQSGNNHPIEIEGLWALENNVPGTDSSQVFFTAGPGDEEHGLFGYIKRK